jgi:transcription antitermination protein NusB
VSSGRHTARERALQALYQIDLSNVEPAAALAAAIAADEGPVDAKTQEFARALIAGVVANLADLDALIQKHSVNWRVERMPKIDRNVLRLAAYELKFDLETPAKVVLNEAIELGKAFGTEESSAFINGILDKLAQELGRK